MCTEQSLSDDPLGPVLLSKKSLVRNFPSSRVSHPRAGASFHLAWDPPEILGLPWCGINNAACGQRTSQRECVSHGLHVGPALLPRRCLDRAAATAGLRKARPALTRGPGLRPRGARGPPPAPASSAPAPSAPLLDLRLGLSSSRRVRPTRGWPQALTVNGPEAPVVRVLHMAPRRHDDKRRTAVRTRGAGPREGAVKGPAPIPLFYRDSRGAATERSCAEREALRPADPYSYRSGFFNRKLSSFGQMESTWVKETAVGIEIPSESRTG